MQEIELVKEDGTKKVVTVKAVKGKHVDALWEKLTEATDDEIGRASCRERV